MSSWKEKKEEPNPLDPQRVFAIKHSDIPRGVTQCVNHDWKILNNHELECTKCPTCVIINPDKIKDYVS